MNPPVNKSISEVEDGVENCKDLRLYGNEGVQLWVLATRCYLRSPCLLSRTKTHTPTTPNPAPTLIALPQPSRTPHPPPYSITQTPTDTLIHPRLNSPDPIPFSAQFRRAGGFELDVRHGLSEVYIVVALIVGTHSAAYHLFPCHTFVHLLTQHENNHKQQGN
ncbi:unnamed protein product [Periconia digitata]|uniref:Uncharacterized protein n=1 Tax=Periconia digitata TaxID=1303443 RepID=A0A9W4XKZ4_9PLEO|nr:unnamed protein product [Periconia digitata]